MKKIFIILSIGSILSLFTFQVHAEENDSYQLEVNLSKPVPQSIEYSDEFGNDIVISVQPMISVFNLGKGTYKVSKTAKKLWVTSYTVTVNDNNQFSLANNLNVLALSGSVSSRRLTYNKSNVVGSFKYKYGIITTTPTVTTTIEQNKLVVK